MSEWGEKMHKCENGKRVQYKVEAINKSGNDKGQGAIEAESPEGAKFE